MNISDVAKILDTGSRQDLPMVVHGEAAKEGDSPRRRRALKGPHNSNMKAFLSIDFALVVTLCLLTLAGSNRAADTDSQGGALKSGAQLWAENCIMCHEVKPRVSPSSAKLDSITRHMREEADLSPEEQEAILGFLKLEN